MKELFEAILSSSKILASPEGRAIWTTVTIVLGALTGFLALMKSARQSKLIDIALALCFVALLIGLSIKLLPFTGVPPSTPGEGGVKQTAKASVLISVSGDTIAVVDAKGRLVRTYGALGMGKGVYLGRTGTIREKKVDADYIISPDLARLNPLMPSAVPGGHPLNPLGKYSVKAEGDIYLASPRAEGRGWITENSGFVLLKEDDARDLYRRVRVNDVVRFVE